jgi:hypothetical protein
MPAPTAFYGHVLTNINVRERLRALETELLEIAVATYAPDERAGAGSRATGETDNSP